MSSVEWVLSSADGKPRLAWIYGSKLTELNPAAAVLDSEKALPPRPELDLLRAMLAFALERVETELAIPPRLVEVRNMAGQAVVES